MSLIKRVLRHKNYVTISLVFLILLFALLLRSNIYIHGDFYFFLDQARDMMLVKEITVDHNLALIGARSGLGGVFHGPLWLYMITPFFIASGGDPYLTLVPLFLLVSVAIVAAGFFIGQKLYDTPTGLFFALLLAITPSLLKANLGTTNAQVMPLIFLIYLFGIINFIRGKDKYLILSMLMIGIGIHFESAFSVFLVPLTFVALIIRRSLPKMKYVLFGFGAMVLAVSNFILFELRNSFLMTQSVMKLFQGKVGPAAGYESYADFGFRVQDRASLLIKYFTETLFQPDNLAQLMIAGLLLGAAALFFFQKRGKEFGQRNKELLFIFLVPFLYYALFTLYPLPLWTHYTLSLTVTSAFLLALAMRQLSTVVVGRLFVIAFMIFILFPTMVWINQTYFNAQPYTPTVDGSYKNQVAAAKKVFADAGDTEFGYFQYSTAILTYNMDYLMWWVGKQKGYTPSAKKLPTTYLIMYPAPAKDTHSHDFWKKNVVRTKAKVSARWVMPGGIIIEKLQVPPDDPEADPNYQQGLLFR